MWTAFEVGDSVYGMLDFMPRRGLCGVCGGKDPELALKPKSIDFTQAAAVPLASLTAWNPFEVSGLQPGQTCLSMVGAGGVGHFAVQFAKWKEAKVIVTASADNEAFLRKLGVDEQLIIVTSSSKRRCTMLMW